MLYVKVIIGQSYYRSSLLKVRVAIRQVGYT